MNVKQNRGQLFLQHEAFLTDMHMIVLVIIIERLVITFRFTKLKDLNHACIISFLCIFL